MKTKKLIYLPLILFIVIVVGACKKTKEKVCWQRFDWFAYMSVGDPICDERTKEELEAATPQFYYYDSKEPTYCWKAKVNNSSNEFYVDGMPQSMVDKLWKPYGYIYNKIDCNSYCSWEVHQKRTHKINGGITLQNILNETFLTDTCSKLVVGKIVKLSETIDSITTREFMKKIH